MNFIRPFMVCASVLLAVGCAPTPTGPSYTIDVTLRNGTPVQCAVNQPGPAPQSSMPLTLREQTEAEVLATQPLRLLSGPRSGYPTPETAPVLHCFVLEGQRG